MKTSFYVVYKDDQTKEWHTHPCAYKSKEAAEEFAQAARKNYSEVYIHEIKTDYEND